MKIGDKVSVLDDDITGFVKGFENGSVVVSTTDDFDLQFAEEELVVVDKNFSDHEMHFDRISEVISEKTERKPSKNRRVKPKERVLPPMEVDLHIHQLVKNSKHMSNYDMLTIQVDTAKRQLDFAISKRIQRIVFIHGVGAGVLKAELEFLFKRYDNLKYYDANFQKYGRGAVEVYIFQNKID